MNTQDSPHRCSKPAQAIRPALAALSLAALFCTALFCAALLAILQLRPAAAAVHAPNQAQVIVQFDDAARVTRAITFSDPISGLAALEFTGLDLAISTTSFGPLVCAIEGVGCPVDDCFCGGDQFWSYAYWDGSAWQSYQVGAGASVISQTGAIEGWRWGEFGAPQIGPATSTAAGAALGYLQTQQSTADGGYGSTGATVEALLAVGSNRLDPAAWRNAGGPSLADAINAGAAAFSQQNVASAGKLAVALAGAGLALPAGTRTPADYLAPGSGNYSAQSGPASWAILGAVALGESVPDSAVSALRARAQTGGGWEWQPGFGVDTNTTALAIRALLAAGEPVNAPAIRAGIAFLRQAQNADGGFPYTPAEAPEPSSPSDANSTAYVVQALYAAGQDPASRCWASRSQTPLDYLRARQLLDGSFEWQPGLGADSLATQQAIPALLGATYPTVAGRVQACTLVFAPFVSP